MVGNFWEYNFCVYSVMITAVDKCMAILTIRIAYVAIT